MNQHSVFAFNICSMKKCLAVLAYNEKENCLLRKPVMVTYKVCTLS